MVLSIAPTWKNIQVVRCDWTTRVPAVLPSIFVAAIHLRLTTFMGPKVNIVFQRWWDTGEPIAGSDLTLTRVYNFLSVPIPTLLLAGHPAAKVHVLYWIATIANSAIWGLALYCCYRLALRPLHQKG